MKSKSSAIALLFSACSFLPLGNAADAARTEWQDLGGGKARMIAIADPETNTVSGVLEIRLEKGWKTYWRVPGEGGIPPEMNFAGSKGFIHSNTTLPVPKSIGLSGIEFTGYEGEVHFGFEGRQIAEGGKIQLDAFLGLCEVVCIPAKVSFEIPASDLAQNSALDAQIMEMASSKMPEKPTPNFDILSAEVEGDQLVVSARIPAGTDRADLFVEGFDQWRIPLAKTIYLSGEQARFKVDLASVPEKMRIGEELRLTLSADGRGVETRKTTSAKTD